MPPDRMSGRPFLQIPGPTLVPERIVRAMAEPIIDHRGPRFAELVRECLDGLRGVFRTNGHVLLFPGSGTGAWEAAIVNTLSPGDRVLACVNGHFSTGFAHASRTLGMSLGVGLGQVKSKVFRIGHLGSLNELDLLAGLAGVELTLKTFGVDVSLGAGLKAAEEYLLSTRGSPRAIPAPP